MVQIHSISIFTESWSGRCSYADECNSKRRIVIIPLRSLVVLGLIEPYIGTAGHALFSPWNGARGNEVELGIIYVTIRQTFIGRSAISRA
jgi:hypothetical protein